ncbi:MAG TPA: glycoside hydrolase family 44 protein [Thermoanaerobaculia bacterium]|nr:glycoside hydrolase family 44 protein [Thermoanaerobaculia bacterium]
METRVGQRRWASGPVDRPGIGRLRIARAALAVGLLAGVGLARPPAALAAAAALIAYDDKLENGFANWSWGTFNFSETAVVHSGTAAISFAPANWSGLFFHRASGIDTTLYDGIGLWIQGSGAGGEVLTVALTAGGSPVGSGQLAAFVPGGAIPAGQWVQVKVPFASLGLTSGSCDGFWLQDGTGGSQPSIYVDDVQLTPRSGPPPPPPAGAPVNVGVDPQAARHPISPFIYGVNFGDDKQAARLHWPVRRWGGNGTTRYSWQDDIANHASDWFFYNIENANSNPAALPNGSASDVFVDATRAAGGQPLVTVPLIGWTPIDRTRHWGFSVAKYGPQQQTECTATGNPSWCNHDAGNGLHPDGTPITGNDPHDTSRAIGPSFVTDWLAHIAARTGLPENGGVRMFALDNEPALWNSTHRDVHPSPTTYDELWQKTLAYAAAIKAAEPHALVFGPADWGWCAYFFSAADGCQAGADAQAHGNLAFIDWYLLQTQQYLTANGVRLIDYLDVHFYPQAVGVALSDDESPATAALRLRTLKSLYDPSYVDESWIGQPVNLVPRMKAWIANRLPGTKFAISEYSWGNDAGLSSALAQAEALAIFGREGVDLATRWVAPAAGSRVEDAFLLYLDYDGQGGGVAGASVQAVSSDVDAVGAYAVDGGARLYLLLFNKATASRPVALQVAGGGSGPVTLFGFDAGHRLGPAGTATVSGGALSLTLAPRSATLAVAELPSTPPPAASFYTVAPCRAFDTRNAAGPYGGPALGGGAARTLDLAGQCGIPAGARAVALNLTVVQPTAAGGLSAYAGGTFAPPGSAISFGPGQVRANLAVLPLSQDGNAALTIQGDLPAGQSVHVLLDVTGYFQ